jgi:hypothetical protein
MCNLYSITTNQAAIAALFRRVNRYVGNLAPHAGRVSGLSGSRSPQHRHRDDPDTLGHTAATTHMRPQVSAHNPDNGIYDESGLLIGTVGKPSAQPKACRPSLHPQWPLRLDG